MSGIILQSSEQAARADEPGLMAPLHTVVFRQVSSEWERCEQELLRAGIPLGLPHRSAWPHAGTSSGSWFLAVRDGTGTCRGGFGLEVCRSRALPGHLLLRVNRLGESLSGATAPVGLAALADLARRNPRILRVAVALFSRERTARRTLGQLLADLGFRPAEALSSTTTLVVDLTPREEVVFGSLSSTARQNIRAAAKHPVAIKVITDPALGPRMRDLETETRQRTGGNYRLQDWAKLLRFSNAYPELTRPVGMFRTDVERPDGLLAFAWGCHHGDHAQYMAGASTQATSLRIPLAYPLLWDLLMWAKRTGAGWFDLGGVTPGRAGGGDPLGGISDFKRRFSKTCVDVGEEWEFEPHRTRASPARAVSACAAWASSARRGWPWSK
jgi:hypothetical protein